MREISITIGGRQLPLIFNMAAWAEIEEKACPIQELGDRLAGSERVRIVNRVAAIMVRAGGAADVTEEWMLKNARPRQMQEMSVKIMDAISAGMEMEASEDDERGEVDVTLREINKKKGPED